MLYIPCSFVSLTWATDLAQYFDTDVIIQDII